MRISLRGLLKRRGDAAPSPLNDARIISVNNAQEARAACSIFPKTDISSHRFGFYYENGEEFLKDLGHFLNELGPGNTQFRVDKSGLNPERIGGNGHLALRLVVLNESPATVGAITIIGSNEFEHALRTSSLAVGLGFLSERSSGEVFQRLHKDDQIIEYPVGIHISLSNQHGLLATIEDRRSPKKNNAVPLNETFAAMSKRNEHLHSVSCLMGIAPVSGTDFLLDLSEIVKRLFDGQTPRMVSAETSCGRTIVFESDINIENLDATIRLGFVTDSFGSKYRPVSWSEFRMEQRDPQTSRKQVVLNFNSCLKGNGAYTGHYLLLEISPTSPKDDSYTEQLLLATLRKVSQKLIDTYIVLSNRNDSELPPLPTGELDRPKL